MRLAGAEEEQGAYILMDDFNLTPQDDSQPPAATARPTPPRPRRGPHPGRHIAANAPRRAAKPWHKQYLSPADCRRNPATKHSTEASLLEAIENVRNALGVDDNLGRPFA